eukprot:scaffold36963_cov63-Phaeocystis_antarctica.AAC.2
MEQSKQPLDRAGALRDDDRVMLRHEDRLALLLPAARHAGKSKSKTNHASFADESVDCAGWGGHTSTRRRPGSPSPKETSRQRRR